jgi:Mannosyltransferase (PIG-V)
MKLAEAPAAPRPSPDNATVPETQAAAGPDHRRYYRTITFTWLAWLAIMIAFQQMLPARLSLQRPDLALSWTPSETRAHSQDNKPTLVDPFLNTHVSWDSEFYLAIAINGYDDPNVRTTQPKGNVPAWLDRPLSLSYAFMPLYSGAIKVASVPLLPLGLDPIAAATLAGVLVSALGALAAMFALYDLARDELGDNGAFRASVYLLIFPTGFFLAQVYSEGLFLGTAFGCLALLRRKQWLPAVLLAVAATWVRPVGVALVLPLGWAWLQELWAWRAARQKATPASSWALALHGVLAALPVLAYLVWNYSFWGQAFHVVEETYFSRGLFAIQRSLDAWGAAGYSVFHGNTQAGVYYLFEVAAVALGLVATAFTWRRYPGVAMFGLAVLVVSLTSGVAQGMLRYVLAMPAIFIFLARLGKSATFDRAWSLGSTLCMGITAMLFSFDMWAG